MIRWVSKGYLRLSLYVILIFEFVLSTFASDLSKAKSICEYFIQFCKLFSFGNNVTILFYTIVVLGIGEHVKRRFDDVDNDPINKNAYTEESPQTDRNNPVSFHFVKEGCPWGFLRICSSCPVRGKEQAF